MAISLKCPKCGNQCALESSKGLEKKTCECPNCHEKMPIKDFLPKLSFKVGSQNYQLHFGRQWVGRRSVTCDSEIQIPDESKYMSKQHAIIEVTCGAKSYIVTFEEHGKNPTEMQGVKLEEDDVVYVNVNDCLQMGSIRLYLAPEYGE